MPMRIISKLRFDIILLCLFVALFTCAISLKVGDKMGYHRAMIYHCSPVADKLDN